MGEMTWSSERDEAELEQLCRKLAAPSQAAPTGPVVMSKLFPWMEPFRFTGGTEERMLADPEPDPDRTVADVVHHVSFLVRVALGTGLVFQDKRAA